MGRRYKNAEIITGPFAKALIQQAGLLDPSTHSQLIILDNACGTGVVAAAVHDLLDSSTKKRMKLTCGDFAEPMLQAVKERIEENGWVNTEARLVDAQVLQNKTHCGNITICNNSAARKQGYLTPPLLMSWPILSSWASKSRMPHLLVRFHEVRSLKRVY